MEANQITYERDGNLIYCFIQIAGERKKLIGTINETNRTLSKRISQRTHTFNKSNSIAIAHEVLKLDFDFIIIECGYNTYKTTRKYFLEKSTFKHFGNYELQKFLSISDFGMEKAMSWEEEQTQKINKVPAKYRPDKHILQMELF